MAFKPEKFTYQPFQEPMDFRLLKLLPGERDDPLNCSLYHSSLTSHPHYYAVSYTWGTPGLFQEIELNGVAHPIQANLFDFLQQLRLPDAPTTLWVDALCINQSDILEKNIQVPLMGAIYSIAKSVFVWLGPQADGSEVYFDSCNQIASESQSALSSWRIQRNVVHDTGNPTAAAIASLQRRTYWTRTWIIQEIVLAADIHIFCGDRSTHWPNFILQMPDRDTGDQAIGMRNPTHPLGKLSKLRIIATRLTLRQLLFQCHMSRCSEPRDLVYGLLSLAKDKESAGSIPVDYSCDLETLFLQSMSACPLTVYDGIPCLQFCDTLSTRLSVDLDRALATAKEILHSNPLSVLAEKLAAKSYFAKLTRFGRIRQPPATNKNSLHLRSASTQVESGNTTQQPLTYYTVREIPGKTLHQMYSLDTPEATDTIFGINFESPTTPTYRLACICRPLHHDVDEYGVIPYQVVGLGVILQQSNEAEDRDERDMQAIVPLLRGDLRSLCGRVVSDSIPGYGLEVGLLELIALCVGARAVGAFVRWSIEHVTVGEHWEWA